MDLSSTIEKYATLGVIAADKLRYWLYYQANKKRKKRNLEVIRKKDIINVAFVVTDLAKWKTENLYIAMASHPRFRPTVCLTLGLGSTLTVNSVIDKYTKFKEYLGLKGYRYVESTDLGQIDVDILIYQEPYEKTYPEGLHVANHNKIIYHMSYAFIITNVKQPLRTPIVDNAEAMFVENDAVALECKKIMGKKGHIVKASGIPFMDMLLAPKEEYENPWQDIDGNKKRIIWAPHFTIDSHSSWLHLGHFLEMYEFMPELACKYQDKIHVAFKPHPNLRPKLERKWGLEKTDKYYNLWREMPNTQVEEGPYIGLFKYSDAMVHDCASFNVEYLYMDKPVLCCIDDNTARKSMNAASYEGYNCARHGATREQVENFIIDVINGRDEEKELRDVYFKQFCSPPRGNTACQNIIKEILGD